MTVPAPLISVLGIPTSAGSHHPGQELAPAAWRAAGLIGGLVYFDGDADLFPHFAGLGLDEAGACLDEFTSGEKFGGLVITEVNPGHDPSGELLGALVKTVAGALAPAR
jgi:arginase family enzyme